MIDRISVIIPSYNHAAYIEKAAYSVLEQTYQNVELIIIDDGSTDNSDYIITRLYNKYPDKIVYKTQENQGAHHAINKGIDISSGSYINILNSDDYFSRDRLQKCIEAAKTYKTEWVFTGVNYIDCSSNAIYNNIYAEKLKTSQECIRNYPTVGYSLLTKNTAISSGNLFFSKTLYRKIGGFKEFKYVHDWDFALRALIHSEPAYINEPHYFYRLHDDNSFTKLSRFAAEETTSIMRNYMQQAHEIFPPNLLAPCSLNWGAYFDMLVGRIDYYVYMPDEWKAAAVGRMTTNDRLKNEIG